MLHATSHRTILATILMILPFAYWNGPLDPVLMTSYCILALVLLATSVALLAANSKSSYLPSWIFLRQPASISFSIYWGLIGISILWATNVSEALFEFARVSLSLVLLLMLVLSSRQNEEDWQFISKLSVVTCLALSTLGLVQILNPEVISLVQYGTPSGTFANRGLFVSYLCMLLPFTFWGFRYLRQYWLVSAILAFMMALSLIILAENRSSWVSITVATTLLVLIFVRRKSIGFRDRRTGRRIALVAIGSLAVVISVMIIAERGQFLLERAKSLVNTNHPSIHERLVCWQKTAQMVRDHPLTGVGAGNCSIIFPAYGIAGTQQEAGDVFFRRPHNDYLWVASEAGIPALLAYLAFFASLSISLVRTIRRTESLEKRDFAVALLSALTCYAVDSLFSFPKERITHLALLMLLASQTLLLGVGRETHLRTPGHRLLTIFYAVMIASCAAILALGWIRTDSEIETRAALKARENQDLPEVIYRIGRARSRLATLDPTSTPLAWYSGVAHFSLGDVDAAFADFETAYADNPNHVHVINNLATCFEMKGNHTRSEELYHEVLAIHPGFVDARLNLAAVFFNTQRYRQALDAMSTLDSTCQDPRCAEFRKAIGERLAASDQVPKL